MSQELDSQVLPNDADIIADASPYWKKLVNTTLTINEKYDLVKQHGIQKDAQIEGYRRGYLTAIPDADSGPIIDEETNSLLDFRAKNINNYDAIDSYGSVYGNERNPRGSWNKQRSQPRMVAELVGKRIEDLTPEDFRNVKNYNSQEWYRAATDPNYQFSKYDRNRIYDEVKLPEGTKIPILYKVVSSGERYDRNLVDLISTATGRSMVFDAMQNPYLNATNMPFIKGDKSEQTFDVYRALGTTENQKKLKELVSKEGYDFVAKVNKAKDNTGIDFTQQASDYIRKYEDSTTWFGRIIDKFAFAGSNAAKSFEDMAERVSRRLSSDNPEKEYLEKLARDSSFTLYDNYIDSDYARKLIYQQAQQEQLKTVEDAAKAYDEGHYLDAAKNYLKALGEAILILPESLSESTAQTATSIAATQLGGKIGAMAGTTIAPGVGSVIGALVGALGGYLAGGVTIAADETLMSMDNYTANNNGKRMSSGQIAEEFAEQFVWAIGEVALQKIGLGKALQGTKLGKLITDAPIKPIRTPNRIGHVIGSGLGEGVQEYGQSTTSQRPRTDICCHIRFGNGWWSSWCCSRYF